MHVDRGDGHCHVPISKKGLDVNTDLLPLPLDHRKL